MMEDQPGFFEMEDLDDKNQASIGVLAGKDEKGAVILEVLPGSAAEKAGGITYRDKNICWAHLQHDWTSLLCDAELDWTRKFLEYAQGKFEMNTYYGYYKNKQSGI